MKNILKLFMYILTPLLFFIILIGCGPFDNSSSSPDYSIPKVQDNNYRYYDIEQVGGTNKYIIAPYTSGLQTLSIVGAYNVVSTLLPSKATSNIDLSKTTIYSLATNSVKNSLAVGTQEGLYIFGLGTNGNILNGSAYEDNSSYSAVGLNKHIASVNYDDNNIIVGFRRGRVAIAKVDSNGQIVSGFTTYDKNSTLNLRFLRDIELYKNMAVILAQKLYIADYNITARTLSNFIEVDDSKLEQSYVEEIAINKQNGLAVLPSRDGLIVGKIEDNGTFSKIKTYKDSVLSARQYKCAAFNSDGNKIAIGAMGNSLFVADIDSSGTISNVINLNPISTNTNNSAIRAIKFSDDNKFILATTDDQKITVIKVSQINGGN